MSDTSTPAAPVTLTRTGTEAATRHKLFVLLPVADLQASVHFYEALGFAFDARFTDATSACLLIGEDAYAMLLAPERFPYVTTRHAADPAYKVARCGALPYSPLTTEATMTDATLGIDVSKKTLDANCVKGQRRQSRAFANSPEGWKTMLDWLKAEAKRLGCVRLQLDSGTQRQDAHAFYLRERLRIEAFHFGVKLD